MTYVPIIQDGLDRDWSQVSVLLPFEMLVIYAALIQ